MWIVQLVMMFLRGTADDGHLDVAILESTLVNGTETF